MSIANPYADERRERHESWDGVAYPVDPLHEQLERVHRQLGLDDTYSATLVDYPSDERADGILALPFLRDLGAAYAVADPTGEGYARLGTKIWDKVNTARNGYTLAEYKYYETPQKPQRFRLNKDVHTRLDLLEAKNPVKEGTVHYHSIPVNAGKLFAGYSPRNACMTALQMDILPLGFAQAACLLLAMPQWVKMFEVKTLNCPADEANKPDRGEWGWCPYFRIEQSVLVLGVFEARMTYAGNLQEGSFMAFPGLI